MSGLCVALICPLPYSIPPPQVRNLEGGGGCCFYGAAQQHGQGFPSTKSETHWFGFVRRPDYWHAFFEWHRSHHPPGRSQICQAAPNIRERNRHININKFGDCPGTGWLVNICLCVFFGGGSVLTGEKKHINKIARKSRDNPMQSVFSSVAFSLPKSGARWSGGGVAKGLSGLFVIKSGRSSLPICKLCFAPAHSVTPLTPKQGTG